MKILLIDSGIPSSTGDVYRYFRAAFERAGHTIIPFQLSARIDQASYSLDRAWQQAGKPPQRPTGADIYFRASEGAITMALRHIPDLILITTSQFFHPDCLILLERAGFNVGIIGTESPYGDQFTAHFMQAVDCGWTQERTSVERLRQRANNARIWYLPAAYDPTIHRPEPLPDDPDDPTTPHHDVVLVATGFAERVALLEAVDWRGIDFGMYGDWATLPKKSKLRKFVRGKVITNRSAVMLYRNAKIGLNLYRDGLVLAGEPGGMLKFDGGEIVPAESLNPRAYELAACGTMQISQERAEVREVFGDSVPTFRAPEELGALVRELLAKPERRQKLVEQAEFAVRDHSFDARVQQITEQFSTLRLATRPVALHR